KIIYSIHTPAMGDILLCLDLKTGETDQLSSILGAEFEIEDFVVDSKGRSVCYRADEDTNDIRELFLRDLKKQTTSKVNGPLVAGGFVRDDYAYDSKGKAIFYRADQEVDDVVELFRTDLKTGENVQVSPPI